MNEHTLHNFGSFNTAARRRRVRAARKRVAATRARMAGSRTAPASATDTRHGSDTTD